MANTIVILFDGTSNEISADRIGMVRLHGALKRSEDRRLHRTEKWEPVFRKHPMRKQKVKASDRKVGTAFRRDAPVCYEHGVGAAAEN